MADGGPAKKNKKIGACCLADGGPTNGYTAVNGLNGKSMTIGSMRVYQRSRPPRKKLCCPRTANEAELQAAFDRLCATTDKVECSPVQPGGVYYEPNTLQHHAQWAFNAYYQRNLASHDSDLLCTSLGSGDVAEIRFGTTDCSQSPNTPVPTAPSWELPIGIILGIWLLTVWVVPWAAKRLFLHNSKDTMIEMRNRATLRPQ